MKIKNILILGFLLLLSSNLFSLDLKAYAVNEFKGLKSFSSKDPYTKAIDGVYIGYDENDIPVTGIAFRKFKSYELITAALIIKFEKGKYVVQKADVLDINKIKKAEQKNKVLDAIGAFNGKTIKEANAEIIRIDAVTGATRYYKQVYDTLNLLTSTIVSEMEKPSNWTKYKL